MVCMAGLQVFIVRFFFQGARKGEFPFLCLWSYKYQRTDFGSRIRLSAFFECFGSVLEIGGSIGFNTWGYFKNNFRSHCYVTSIESAFINGQYLPLRQIYLGVHRKSTNRPICYDDCHPPFTDLPAGSPTANHLEIIEKALRLPPNPYWLTTWNQESSWDGWNTFKTFFLRSTEQLPSPFQS